MARALRWASAARAAVRHLKLPTNVTVVVGEGGAEGVSEGARAASGLAAALAGAGVPATGAGAGGVSGSSARSTTRSTTHSPLSVKHKPLSCVYQVLYERIVAQISHRA